MPLLQLAFVYYPYIRHRTPPLPVSCAPDRPGRIIPFHLTSASTPTGSLFWLLWWITTVFSLRTEYAHGEELLRTSLFEFVNPRIRQVPFTCCGVALD